MLEYEKLNTKHKTQNTLLKACFQDILEYYLILII